MDNITRRQFFGYATATALAALASLLGTANDAERCGARRLPHFKPTAKRVIYLFQSGGPSQMELFDYKPKLVRLAGNRPSGIRSEWVSGSRRCRRPVEVPGRALEDTSSQQHGNSGAWVSELLPHTAQDRRPADVRQVLHTEAINHDPAVTFIQTGSQIAGRPSMGAWLSYGLGAETRRLARIRRHDLAGQGGSRSASL